MQAKLFYTGTRLTTIVATQSQWQDVSVANLTRYCGKGHVAQPWHNSCYKHVNVHGKAPANIS